MLTLPTHVDPVVPRSVLPTGGSPETDRAYLKWREQVMVDLADRIWLETWPYPALIDPLPESRFDGILFARLAGQLPLWGDLDPITYSHRLRFLGVAILTRKREVNKILASLIGEVIRGLERS